MAISKQFQERLRGAVREAIKKCLAEGDLPEALAGEARFTTIETLALAAGNADTITSLWARAFPAAVSV